MLSSFRLYSLFHSVSCHINFEFEMEVFLRSSIVLLLAFTANN